MTTPGSAGPSGPTVARVLLEIGAVLMRPKDPFILTSGRASPVYVDCRKVIGFPRARSISKARRCRDDLEILIKISRHTSSQYVILCQFFSTA